MNDFVIAPPPLDALATKFDIVVEYDMVNPGSSFVELESLLLHAKFQNLSLIGKVVSEKNSFLTDDDDYLRWTDNEVSLVVRKAVFGISDQVRHKPGCTATEDGWRLEFYDLGSSGIVLSV